VCSVSQYIAVCCSVMQCIAVCCSVLQCIALYYIFIMKYALELQGYGAPNGHTDTSAARLVLSAQPTRAEIRQASLS